MIKRRKFLQSMGLVPFITNTTFSEHEQVTSDAPQYGDTNTGRDFFYKPNNGWAADFIPLFTNGRFELFYLIDFRNKEKFGEGTPWYRISTTNFVDYEEHGEVLARGKADEQDLFVFTGSAIEADGKYHIFYTGHNYHFIEQGKPQEAIMHAVSDDLKTWKKIPEQKFFAPADKYEADDWRDPFVFWNEETNEYNMLVAARLKKGLKRRRGLTALCTSKNLSDWQVKGSFYSPNLYFTHECPDLFKMGNWWYLVFSEFSDKVKTRYRKSMSMNGPWLTPEVDDFDSHAFYAAKTASDGKDRFLFGWNPTRRENNDNGTWEWGGNLVVHQLHQNKNGDLLVKAPDSVKQAFTVTNECKWNTLTSGVTAKNNNVAIKSTGSFGAVLGGKLPDLCKITAQCRFKSPSRDFGLCFHSTEDLEKSFYIRFEPKSQRVVFDKWPRQRPELPHMVEFERRVRMNDNDNLAIELFIEGTKGVLYVNESIAMNFRCYDFSEGQWGLFATDADVSFTDISINTLK